MEFDWTIFGGRYEEAPEPGRPAVPETLLDVLAFGVTAGIPLDRALETFLPADAGYSPGGRNARERLIGQLRAGEPLSGVLEECRKALRLPESLPAAIRCAEENGTLPQALPLLADHWRVRRPVSAMACGRLIRAFLYWLLILWIAVGIWFFIKPNWTRIFEDLLGVGRFDDSTVRMLFMVDGALMLAILTGGLMLVCFPSGLLSRIPGLGRLVRMQALYELSGSMQCFLASGCDILTAARWTREAEPRRWMRRRLDRFICRMEQGEAWLDAWSELKLRNPLYDWLLSQAAARGSVAAGFGELRQLTAGAYRRRMRLLVRVVSMAFMLCSALLVGAAAYLIFETLTLLVSGLSA